MSAWFLAKWHASYHSTIYISHTLDKNLQSGFRFTICIIFSPTNLTQICIQALALLYKYISHTLGTNLHGSFTFTTLTFLLCMMITEFLRFFFRIWLVQWKIGTIRTLNFKNSETCWPNFTVKFMQPVNNLPNKKIEFTTGMMHLF